MMQVRCVYHEADRSLTRLAVGELETPVGRLQHALFRLTDVDHVRYLHVRPILQLSSRCFMCVFFQSHHRYLLLIMYHRERILKTSTLSCNEEKEEITKPPTK